MLAICRKRSPQSHTRQAKRRLMHSTGHNIVTVGIEDKYWKYLSDLYTTLIDIKWRWNILIFASGFVLTWLFFAAVYYWLGYLHGDFEEDHNADFIPCILNCKTFTGAYLFSIETMMTIGYGVRVQTESCPGLYITVMLQSIVGAGLQFMLASIVVSKTRRAKRRSETILFSNHVCIYEQDSKLHLAIRVGDMRKSEIAGAHAQGYLIKKCKSKDGTFVPVRSYNVILKGETGRDLIFFPWPTQILHLVDEDSPLWSLSRDELFKGRYELIVVIDGVSGATSRPFQARKSYHTSEMKWGHRFADLELLPGSGGSYLMSLSNFHKTVPTSAPLCSAQDITHLREMYKATHQEPELHDQQLSTHRSKHVKSSSTEALPRIEVISETDNGSQTSSQKPIRSRRSKSVEERITPKKPERQRRCSLGSMIRVAQGDSVAARSQYVDALNIYRHRRSVTDTYLGEEIEEDTEEVYDSNDAILSVVSQRSSEKRTDIRDSVKPRRNSVQLFFGKETEDTGDAEDGYTSNQVFLSVRSQRGTDKRTDVREVFPRRKSSVQLLFGPEPRRFESDIILEKRKSGDSVEDSQTVMSVPSQKGEDRRTDVREVFIRRKSCVQFVGSDPRLNETDTGNSDNLDDGSQAAFSVKTRKGTDRKPDAREVSFTRRKSTVQFEPDPRLNKSEPLLEEQ